MFLLLCLSPFLWEIELEISLSTYFIRHTWHILHKLHPLHLNKKYRIWTYIFLGKNLDVSPQSPFFSLQILIIMTVYSYHVTYTFQSESTLYSCLNVKELLGRSRREIWRLKDCNGTRTHNHLVSKLTLKPFSQIGQIRLQTKWLWVRVPLQSPNDNLKNRCHSKIILGHAVFKLLFESTFSLKLSLLLTSSIRWLFYLIEARGKYKQVIKFG